MKKSNRKGFTLIELIAVVVILGVIALIAVPAVTYYLSGAQADAYQIAEKNLAEAANNMFADCAGVGDLAVCQQYSVPDGGNYVTVPASVLIANGYLDPIADPAKQGSYCDENNSFAIVMNDATDTDFNAKLSYKACLSCSKYQSDGCNFDNTDVGDSILNPADFTVNQCENFETHLSTYGIDLRAKVLLNGQDVNRFIMPTPSTIDTTYVGTYNLNYAYGGLTAVTKVTVKDISKPTSPVVTMTANGARYDGRTWTGSNVIVSFSATDNTSCGGMTVDGSGVKEYKYSKDGGSTWTTVSSGYTETETFNGNVLVKAVDNDGNESNTTTFHMMVDKTPPKMVQATLTTVEDGRGYTQGATTYQDVRISLEGTDAHSGFDRFIYSTDGGTSWRDVPSNWIIDETTNTTFRVKAVDKVGNRSTNTITFTIRINKNFTVSYNANGGTVSPTSKRVVYGGTYGALATPTRTGYSFAGWYTSASGGTQITSTSRVTQHQNHTIYAHWNVNSYTLTYNYSANGGSSATRTSASVGYGLNADLSVTAYKNGYTFVGWNTNKNATTGLSSYKMPSNNATLYAIFKKTITATVYSGTNRSTVKTVSTTVYNNTTSGNVTLPTSYASVSGYSFSGYRTDGNATSRSYTAGQSISLSNSTTFYAVYTKTITVSYNANGGNSTPGTQSGTAYYNTNGATTNPTFTLAGAISKNRDSGGREYTFTTWSGYAAGSRQTFSSNQTLTAGWSVTRQWVVINQGQEKYNITDFQPSKWGGTDEWHSEGGILYQNVGNIYHVDQFNYLNIQWIGYSAQPGRYVTFDVKQMFNDSNVIGHATMSTQNDKDLRWVKWSTKGLIDFSMYAGSDYGTSMCYTLQNLYMSN